MKDTQKLAMALVLTGAILLLAAYVFLVRKAPEPYIAKVPEMGSVSAEPAVLKPLIVQGASRRGTRSDPANESIPETPSPVVSSEPPSAPPTPTEDRIFERLQLQSRYFFRCYSHLLESDPSQKGRVLIGFTIAPTGAVSFSQISQSDFESEMFHRCLLDVLNRTPFQTFQGSPVSTLFPLEFE